MKTAYSLSSVRRRRAYHSVQWTSLGILLSLCCILRSVVVGNVRFRPYVGFEEGDSYIIPATWEGGVTSARVEPDAILLLRNQRLYLPHLPFKFYSLYTSRARSALRSVCLRTLCPCIHTLPAKTDHYTTWSQPSFSFFEHTTIAIANPAFVNTSTHVWVTTPLLFLGIVRFIECKINPPAH